MLNKKIIGVIVPAYNEENLIQKTLSTMPIFVDKIIVVNDGSTDATLKIIKKAQVNDDRITILDVKKNCGLGQSLIRGYLKSKELNIDVIAVMAGDAQMDPDDLIKVVTPLANGIVSYSKGNRLFKKKVIKKMPFHRLVGNAGLTFLTKFATGYWHVVDPQCGYTAITKEALDLIPIENMTKKYGYNADILNMLNIQNMKVADVPVEPVYGDEISKIKLYKYVPHIIYLLIRLFMRRMIHKYFAKNFNPLALSYLTGGILMLTSIPFVVRFIYMYSLHGVAPRTTLLCLIFIVLSSIQILLSAVQYDMEDNRQLSVFL
jgi:glycosyltransferase involved in cell wall biosynthesis